MGGPSFFAKLRGPWSSSPTRVYPEALIRGFRDQDRVASGQQTKSAGPIQARRRAITAESEENSWKGLSGLTGYNHIQNPLTLCRCRFLLRLGRDCPNEA
jgi:hypothetical protein